MKIGDRLPVDIQGVTVGEAVVEDIEEGVATIVIPATRLQAKVRQELDLAATDESSGPDRVFGGIEDNQPAVSPAQEEVSSAPPVEVGEGIHGKELDSSAID